MPPTDRTDLCLAVLKIAYPIPSPALLDPPLDPYIVAHQDHRARQVPDKYRGLTTEYFLRPLRGLWKYSSVRSRAARLLIAGKRSAQAVGSGLKERRAGARSTAPGRALALGPTGSQRLEGRMFQVNSERPEGLS